MNDIDKAITSRRISWREADETEKIKRLREEVKRLTRLIGDLANTIYLLKGHEHINGKIMVNQEWYSQEAHPRPEGDDVYF